jgi:flavin reductase (DIM6/NTAB) family NADH-FMN oxidoreductase RutF
MTRTLRERLYLWAGRVPRYVAVGERDPQHQIRVALEGLGPSIDVTRNHVVAGLQPLTIALALSGDLHPETTRRHPVRLTFSPQSDPGTVLGEVELTQDGTIQADGTTLHLFRRSNHTDRSMPPLAAAVFGLREGWSEWKRRRRPGFHMDPSDLAAFLVLYVCPRPVVLVTVQHGEASNLFPMDLIGPTDSPYFLMALRSTNPSIGLIRESRRMALADVPLEHARVAYQLGEHHRKDRVDWSSLPFDTVPSPAHGFPVIRSALRHRDVIVRDVQVVNSHTLFITEVVHEQRRDDGLQLFHTSGPYYRYLVRRGIELPVPTMAR